VPAVFFATRFGQNMHILFPNQVNGFPGTDIYALSTSLVLINSEHASADKSNLISAPQIEPCTRSICHTKCPKCFPNYGINCQTLNNVIEFGVRCSACLPGKALAADDAWFECSDCPVGTSANNPGSGTCTACAIGQYQPAPGKPTCSLCPEFAYAPITGSTECQICDLGTAMVPNEQGALHCQSCAAGRYQNIKGQRSCFACPTDTYSQQVGNTAPAECLKCTDFATATTTNGSIGVANATLGCVCQKNFWHNPQPAKIIDDYCLPCPVGSRCPHPNTIVGSIVSKQGYWRESQYATAFYACHRAQDCPGGMIRTSRNDQCVTGNAGVVCAVCATNHVRINGKCTVCGNGTSASGLPWMIAIACLLYMAVLIVLMKRAKPKVLPTTKTTTANIRTSIVVLSAIAKMRRKSNRDGTLGVEDAVQDEASEKASETTGDDAGDFEIDALSLFTGRMRVFFGFMQVNAALDLAVDVPWPRAFLTFIDISKIINVDFMWLASPFSPCSFHASYLDVFYVHMWILPIVVACTALAFVMARRKRSQETKEAMFHVAIRVINVVVFVLYPGIGTRIFRIFKCRQIGDAEYLMADFSIQCWQPDHYWAVGAAALCILVYIVGIPAGSVYLLYRRKDKLGHADTVSLFGSLYLAYERPFWYWESVEMTKKMILAGGLVMVATGSSAQVLIGMLVALAYLMVVIRLEPYEDIVADRLQMVTSLQIMLNLLIGLVVKLDAKSPGQSEYDTHAVGIILVIMNVGIVVLGVSMALVAFPLFQSRKACFEKTKAWCKKTICCCKHKKRKAIEQEVEMGAGMMTASRRRSLALEKSLAVKPSTASPLQKSNNIPLVSNPLRADDSSAVHLPMKKSKPRQHHHSPSKKKKRRSTVTETLENFRTREEGIKWKK
jgi:hypothetical protein